MEHRGATRSLTDGTSGSNKMEHPRQGPPNEPSMVRTRTQSHVLKARSGKRINTPPKDHRKEHIEDRK